MLKNEVASLFESQAALSVMSILEASSSVDGDPNELAGMENE